MPEGVRLRVQVGLWLGVLVRVEVRVVASSCSSLDCEQFIDNAVLGSQCAFGVL